MAIESYVTRRNLGRLQNDLDIAKYIRGLQIKKSYEKEESLRKSQGEGWNTVADLAGRGIAAYMSGGMSEAAGAASSAMGATQQSAAMKTAGQSAATKATAQAGSQAGNWESNRWLGKGGY